MNRWLPLLAALLLATPALAQQEYPPQTRDAEAQQKRELVQPGNNAPVWRNVQSGAPASTSLPGRETDVLIQAPARFPGQDVSSTAGEAWRQFRNGPVTLYGGWLVAGVAVAILLFYAWKGSLKLRDPPSGRQLRRFSALEMTVHWTLAISFCVLAISGLVMLFGKHLLLPLIGYTVFAWLTMLAKNAHNFIAPLFIVSALAMIVIFLRDNLPRRYDLRWIASAWGYMSGRKHVPTGRFNAGEKVWFWVGVVGLSIMVSGSGLVLLFPNFDQTRAVMQDAWAVHAIAALVYMALALGHIYLGTIGVAGTYGNMRHGWTDETWAREHHEIWYEEVKSGRRRTERRPASGGPTPAGAAHREATEP